MAGCDRRTTQSDQDHPNPFFRTRFSNRIDELLDLASRDPVAARAQARIVLEWLKRLKCTGQQELDRQVIIREFQRMIELLSKEIGKEP